MAAVLGGTQSLHCNGRDEALGLPTEEAARIALRTQQVLSAETGVANTVDPVGGSWAIEEETSRIEREATAILAEIDAAGGTLAAIEQGAIQRRIQDSAYAAQQAVERGEAVVVGVNRYVTNDAAAPSIELQRIDPASEARQAEAVRRVRATRDARACQAALDNVAGAAAGSANLVPAVVSAVEARATLGEIADAMRRVFGEHREFDT
jgi:methylmalonyl-CoA mutase N-terminal domain/subunit